MVSRGLSWAHHTSTICSFSFAGHESVVASCQRAQRQSRSAEVESMATTLTVMVGAAMATRASSSLALPLHGGSLTRSSAASGPQSVKLSTSRTRASLTLSCRYRIRCSASNSSSEESTVDAADARQQEEGQNELQEQQQQQKPRRSQKSRVGGESTDWIASSLTRRFGLGAGLAWVGFLAFGVISEQIKTRTEVYLETQGTKDVDGGKEVVLPNGIRYVDLRKGGGSAPYKGDLVVVDITGKDRRTGEVFVDTTAKDKRPLAFVFLLKPYAGGVCDGVELAMESMKAGGIRKVIVPPELGFGETGADFGDVKIPGGEELEYVVSLQRVSIAPS